MITCAKLSVLKKNPHFEYINKNPNKVDARKKPHIRIWEVVNGAVMFLCWGF